MNRATRRHHHARMITRTRRFLANTPCDVPEASIKRQAENRKVCSCPMCGNQRRHWGAPIRELRDRSVLTED